MPREQLQFDEPSSFSQMPPDKIEGRAPKVPRQRKPKEVTNSSATSSSSEGQMAAKKGRSKNQLVRTPSETLDKRCFFQTPESLRASFLAWLRQPENQELYNELLTLNPVLLVSCDTDVRNIIEQFQDRLVETFGAEHLPTKASTTTVFTDVLDELHVTFCMRQDGWQRRRHKH